MPLVLSENSSSFELAPAGVHPARCFGLVDLGTQTSQFSGQTSRQPKLQLRFELLGEDRMADGRPYVITRRLTASLNEKAALRGLLKSWRGRDFTADELKKFDLKSIVGAYALANIVHEASRDGSTTYANLSGLMPLPKGMPKPAPVNDAIIFDLAQPDPAAWELLSEKMQDLILASPEGDAWRKSYSTPATDYRPGDDPESVYELDDVIPF